MGQIVPALVERYLSGLNRLGDPVLRDIAAIGAKERLPQVGPEVGAFLYVLATAIGATRMLEIGTAIGYSGVWLARALPPTGMLLTLEADLVRARTARVSVIIGDARRMLAKVSGPFDFIFQDGDKRLYTPLLDRLVELLRPGGLLITDNVLWDGEVVPGYADAPKRDAAETSAIAEYNERLNADPRLMTTTVPLRDGLAISLKRSA
jgi:predicted O-methyltransferase YrrM